jgi:hypothetical protein
VKIGGVADRRGMPGWAAFGLWFTVGAVVSLGILAALSIGFVMLPVGLIGAAALAMRSSTRRGVLGVVSGLGVPLMYVAFLNRDGPGTSCHAANGGVDCAERWSPWPWLGLGSALVILGLVLYVNRSRHLEHQRAQRA